MLKRNLIPRCVGAALTVAFLCAMNNSAPSGGSFTRECAARDLQILMLIEERESANAISEQKVTDAVLTMMHARMVCYEGRVVDALALYENVTQELTGARTIVQWGE